MIPGIHCASCAFFAPPPFQGRQGGAPIKGQCRRHAPVLTTGDSGRPISIWPLIGSDQWCGEHAEVGGGQ